MTQTFTELTIGDVLLAPFVLCTVAALVFHLLLRPVLRAAGFDRCFSNPAAAQLSVFVLILAAVVLWW